MIVRFILKVRCHCNALLHQGFGLLQYDYLGLFIIRHAIALRSLPSASSLSVSAVQLHCNQMPRSSARTLFLTVHGICY